jgi:hypothetical protein
MRRHRRHISLSLSLSLSTPGLAGKKPSVGAGLGAPHDLPAGHRRAPGCGIRVACGRRGAARLLAYPRVGVDLGRPPCTPGVASKGAKALVPSPVWFPGRRGFLSGRGAHPSCGPSRAPEHGIGRSRLAGRGACSSVTTPSPVAFEEAPTRAPSRAGSVSAERRGPDPGPRRSPIFFPRPLGASSHNNRGALVPSDSQEER